MHDSATEATLRRWQSELPGAHERLHRLLLEQVTPMHLQQVLTVEGLPTVSRSPAWFMWRMIATIVLPDQFPDLIAALPHQASTLESIREVWSAPLRARGVVLLELHEPDLERLTATGLANLVTSLSRSLETDVALSGVFVGMPHLRPEQVALLELSIESEGITRLVEDSVLLESITVGGCPLHGLHTAHEQVWTRKPPPPPAVERSLGFAVLLTGVVLFLVLLFGVLIPRYTIMVVRAKRAEVPANIDGIKTAEIAYNSAFGSFVEQSSFVPSDSLGKGTVVWPSGTGFDTLGWKPDGAVRGIYKVDLLSTTPKDFRVTGACDVDVDDVRARYTATRTTNATQLTDNDVL